MILEWSRPQPEAGRCDLIDRLWLRSRQQSRPPVDRSKFKVQYFSGLDMQQSNRNSHMTLILPAWVNN